MKKPAFILILLGACSGIASAQHAGTALEPAPRAAPVSPSASPSTPPVIHLGNRPPQNSGMSSVQGSASSSGAVSVPGGTPTAPGGIAPATGNTPTSSPNAIGMPPAAGTGMAGAKTGSSTGVSTSPGTGVSGTAGNTAAGNAGASGSGPGTGSAIPPAGTAPPPGTGMAAGATTMQGGNGAASAARPGAGAARFDPSSVPAWSMMTPQEQQAYSDRMNNITTLGQCRAFHEAAMAQMQSRARAMGQTMDARQASDPCTAMQKQGTLQR